MIALLPNYSSRPYRAADRDVCLGLFDSNVPEYFAQVERTGFETFLDELPGPYLVIEAPSGRLVACGGYAHADDPRRVDLCWGMVHREMHGWGIGHFLTETRVEAAFAEPSVEMIALNTSQLTVAFYRRLGFRLESVEPDGYAAGLDRCELRLARGDR